MGFFWNPILGKRFTERRSQDAILRGGGGRGNRILVSFNSKLTFIHMFINFL